MNALRVGSTTGTGQVLRDSVGLLECIEKVETELHKRVDRRPVRTAHLPGRPDEDPRLGVFSAAFKNTGLGGGATDPIGCGMWNSMPTAQWKCAPLQQSWGRVYALCCG